MTEIVVPHWNRDATTIVARSYKEIRKDYIDARVNTILQASRGRLRRRDAKEQACAEFDTLIAEQRRVAVAKAMQQEGTQQ